MVKFKGMKKTAVLLSACAAFFTFIFSASAQELQLENPELFLKGYVSRNWTVDDGLTVMNVNDMLQDTNGYIYIGSYDGLVRFDGKEFFNINRSLNPNYDFTSVRVLFQDSKGRLWLGHNDEGASVITTEGVITKYTMNIGLPNNSIRAICEDKEGNIWLGTASGICYIDSHGYIIHPTGGLEVNATNLTITSLFCDKEGRVWIATGKSGDLWVYKNRLFTKFEGITKIENPSVNYVTQDRSGAYWFGVNPHYAVRIQDGSETVYTLKSGPKEGGAVNVIYQDWSGNMWFGMNCGISVIHGTRLSCYDKTNGLVSDKITDIMQDNEGHIWYASSSGGLCRLSECNFKTYTMDNATNAICCDYIRNVAWIGGDDGLFCVKDGQFVENEITELCKNIRIRHVSMTADNELLISTYMQKGQLCVMPDGTVKQWTKKTGLTGNKCRVALKSRNGDYYIGTTEGLNIVDHTTGDVLWITKNNGIKNDYIMALYEAKDGSIWCGTDGGGIFILKDRSVVKTYTNYTGLPGNIIYKIQELRPGELWVSTGSGIARYNAEKDTFDCLNPKSGLGTESIFQVLCDYTQTAWLTSNRGIFSVPLSELEASANGEDVSLNVRFYGKSEGLVSNGATSTALCTKDNRGRIWFTLIDGYCIYDPARSHKNNIAPAPVIETYTIDNVKYPYRGEPIVLPPGAKRLTLKYTAITFTAADQIRFKSKLEGFDKDYSDWTAERTVSYTSLPPATYQFRMYCQNNDKIESVRTPPVTVIKKAFPWQLPWFWILVVGFMVLAAFTVIGMRMRGMKKKQEELELKVKERTKDLQAEKEKSEKLLLNILPKDIADELSEKPGQIIAKEYPKVTVLFTDIVSFTKISGSLTAEQVVSMLNDITTRFDERAVAEGIEKIKTIGDSYMAAVGLRDDPDNHDAEKMVRFAKGLLQDLEDYNSHSEIKVQIRIGINTGDLVAGVIGKTKFIYDVWGDTVNVASRMESTGQPMFIHVTENTYNETKHLFNYSDGIEVEVKGKGKMKTYFIEN